MPHGLDAQTCLIEYPRGTLRVSACVEVLVGRLSNCLPSRVHVWLTNEAAAHRISLRCGSTRCERTILRHQECPPNAHVATFAWTTAGKDDKRLTREPDILVTHKSGSFFSGEDPTLITALAQVP